MLQVAAIVDAKLDLSPAHHPCPALQVSGCFALPLLSIGWITGGGSRSSKHDLGLDFICNDHPSPMTMNDQQQLAIMVLFTIPLISSLTAAQTNPREPSTFCYMHVPQWQQWQWRKQIQVAGSSALRLPVSYKKTCCTVWFLAGIPPWRTLLGQLPSCWKWFGMRKVRFAKSGNPGPSWINSGGTKQAPWKSFFLRRSQVSVSIYLWNLIAIARDCPLQVIGSPATNHSENQPWQHDSVADVSVGLGPAKITCIDIQKCIQFRINWFMNRSALLTRWCKDQWHHRSVRTPAPVLEGQREASYG